MYAVIIDAPTWTRTHRDKVFQKPIYRDANYDACVLVADSHHREVWPVYVIREETKERLYRAN